MSNDQVKHEWDVQPSTSTFRTNSQGPYTESSFARSITGRMTKFVWDDISTTVLLSIAQQYKHTNPYALDNKKVLVVVLKQGMQQMGYKVTGVQIASKWTKLKRAHWKGETKRQFFVAMNVLLTEDPHHASSSHLLLKAKETQQVMDAVHTTGKKQTVRLKDTPNSSNFRPSRTTESNIEIMDAQSASGISGYNRYSNPMKASETNSFPAGVLAKAFRKGTLPAILKKKTMFTSDERASIINSLVKSMEVSTRVMARKVSTKSNHKPLKQIQANEGNKTMQVSFKGPITTRDNIIIGTGTPSNNATTPQTAISLLNNIKTIEENISSSIIDKRTLSIGYPMETSNVFTPKSTKTGSSRTKVTTMFSNMDNIVSEESTGNTTAFPADHDLVTSISSSCINPSLAILPSKTPDGVIANVATQNKRQISNIEEISGVQFATNTEDDTPMFANRQFVNGTSTKEKLSAANTALDSTRSIFFGTTHEKINNSSSVACVLTSEAWKKESVLTAIALPSSTSTITTGSTTLITTPSDIPVPANISFHTEDGHTQTYDSLQLKNRAQENATTATNGMENQCETSTPRPKVTDDAVAMEVDAKTVNDSNSREFSRVTHEAMHKMAKEMARKLFTLVKVNKQIPGKISEKQQKEPDSMQKILESMENAIDEAAATTTTAGVLSLSSHAIGEAASTANFIPSTSQASRKRTLNNSIPPTVQVVIETPIIDVPDDNLSETEETSKNSKTTEQDFFSEYEEDPPRKRRRTFKIKKKGETNTDRIIEAMETEGRKDRAILRQFMQEFSSSARSLTKAIQKIAATTTEMTDDDDDD